MTDVSQSFLCSACGTLNRVHLHACWCCHKPLDPDTDELVESPPGAATAPGPAQQGKSGRDTTFVVIVTALAVICLGAFLIVPGVGILLAIASIIPIVRTTMVVSRRAGGTSRSSAVLLFLSSMVVTWIIVTVVAMAAVATFCLACLGTAHAAGEGAFVIAGAAALAVIILLVLAFRKWVKTRWRRDVSGG